MCVCVCEHARGCAISEELKSNIEINLAWLVISIWRTFKFILPSNIIIQPKIQLEIVLFQNFVHFHYIALV